MGRILFLLLCLVVVLGAGGVVMLGAFPPQPRTEQVQRVLPNDKFAPNR